MTSSIHQKFQYPPQIDEVRADWSQKTQALTLTIFAIGLIEAGTLCYFLGTNSSNLEFINGIIFATLLIPSFVTFCIATAGKAL